MARLPPDEAEERIAEADRQEESNGRARREAAAGDRRERLSPHGGRSAMTGAARAAGLAAAAAPTAREEAMTAYNAVRFRVKPGREQQFLAAHRAIGTR